MFYMSVCLAHTLSFLIIGIMEYNVRVYFVAFPVWGNYFAANVNEIPLIATRIRYY